MPRWLLLGLLTAVTVGVVISFGTLRVRIPDDCRLAASSLGAEEYDRAIDLYLRCLDTEDLSAEVLARLHFGLGIAYSAKGNHHQAIEDYTASLHFDPNNAWAYNNRCWSYGHLRRANQALADCNRALRLLPDQPEILDSRALAYWLLDDTDKARQDLERAHQLGPSFPTSDERLREFEGLL